VICARGFLNLSPYQTYTQRKTLLRLCPHLARFRRFGIFPAQLPGPPISAHADERRVPQPIVERPLQEVVIPGFADRGEHRLDRRLASGGLAMWRQTHVLTLECLPR
jgi:hypothetical protein